ncbi:hypothetical protein [Bacillus taeanensis]|uniref:YneQ n=1 Tax=Bacillus taeanensis TaxID=273032 RepID=A0A366XPN6_9BACI|nr:hypothetical protein [Bacillus taeanensis]RBW67696.1 hypothetical protein DS031_20705 [Bacillus taeanensis]
MAFGLSRAELNQWKKKVKAGEIAFITHYWLHPKDPSIRTVTKVGCSNLTRLTEWGNQYGLKKEWIHQRDFFPHYDLVGHRQKEILIQENQWEQLKRFKIK